LINQLTLADLGRRECFLDFFFQNFRSPPTRRGAMCWNSTLRNDAIFFDFARKRAFLCGYIFFFSLFRVFFWSAVSNDAQRLFFGATCAGQEMTFGHNPKTVKISTGSG
jgi:hypothetical protein